MQDISGAGVYDERRAESVKIMEDPCISCAYKSNTTKPVHRLGSRYINVCIKCFLDRSFYEADIFVPFWSLLQLHNSHVTSIVSPRQTASVIAFSASSFGGHVHASYPNGGHWWKWLVDAGRACWNVVTIKPFVKKTIHIYNLYEEFARPIRMKGPTPRLLQTRPPWSMDP